VSGNQFETENRLQTGANVGPRVGLVGRVRQDATVASHPARRWDQGVSSGGNSHGVAVLHGLDFACIWKAKPKSSSRRRSTRSAKTRDLVVGGGKACFPVLDHPTPLRLIETRTFGSGAVYTRYQCV
jgi:hypothetical protein